MPNSERKEELPIEQRVARLEGKIGWRNFDVDLDAQMFVWSAGLLGVSLLCCYVGLGLPNHYYQLALGGLTIALCYHRAWLVLPKKTYQWSLAVLNTLVLSLLFKLFIGGGKRFPFFWLQYPTISSNAGEKADSWVKVVPSWEVNWIASPYSDWSIDLTIIQTFLTLITLIGALFEFQPFVSFTAFLLILVSLPALVGFNWPWIFPAIVLAGIALYLQSTSANSE